MFNKKNTCSIIVTFFPDSKKFKYILHQHTKNFSYIIIVNNSPKINLNYLKKNKKIYLINNKTNIGLAKALNIGIKKAKKIGMKMVSLFDQDTYLKDNYSEKMFKNINQIKLKNKIALYNCRYFNLITNRYGSMIKFKFLRLIREKARKKDKYSYVEYVITSGSFIPINVFQYVGYMKDKLFIDYIDIEWCLRAKKKGYKIIIFQNIEIFQKLGESKFTIFGNVYPIHTPQRMYYNFRNSILLYKSNYIETNWKFVDGFRNIFRILFYILLTSKRIQYSKYIIKGIYHGIINKSGRL